MDRAETGADRIARREAAALLGAAFLALALGPTLAACGKRGKLEPPPDEKSDFPRAYPDPKSY